MWNFVDRFTLQVSSRLHGQFLFNLWQRELGYDHLFFYENDLEVICIEKYGCKN